MKEVEEALALFGNDIYRLSLMYLKNTQDAEDIVQDTLLKLMQYNGFFNNREHEKAWLLKVAVNLCKDKLKSAAYKRNVSLYDYQDTLESKAESFEEGNEVLEAVAKLPVKYRTVIHLYYYEGYSSVEISEIMKKSDSTVRSLLRRGRMLLQKSLKGGEDYEC
ncbi:MAG: RNA polymerase sigma factor [Lachnospiraceae bacterium]|nr:RNA polymerase sigma factor [Lachnospiraceae bacterium]